MMFGVHGYMRVVLYSYIYDFLSCVSLNLRFPDTPGPRLNHHTHSDDDERIKKSSQQDFFKKKIIK